MINSRFQSIDDIKESKISFCINVIDGEVKGIHGLTPETARLIQNFSSAYLKMCDDTKDIDKLVSKLEPNTGEHHHLHGFTHSFFPAKQDAVFK